MSRVETIPETKFGSDSYLRDRSTMAGFVTVEIGHGAEPIARNNPEFYTDRRAYIGIEADLRDPIGIKANEINEFRRCHSDKNIFFLSHRVGGIAVREDGLKNSVWYEGPYDPETLLPKSIADEVFLSNVFSDPHIAYSRERTNGLLKEASRLVSESGTIVLRDNITPGLIRHLDEDSLIQSGLELMCVVDWRQSDWIALEEVFRTDDGLLSQVDGSCYRFISKIAQIEY